MRYIHFYCQLKKKAASSECTIAIIVCLFLVHLFLRTGEICPGNLDENCVLARLDFRRSLVSGLPSPEGRGLLSRTAAGNRAYVLARIGKLISVCKLFPTGLCS